MRYDLRSETCGSALKTRRRLPMACQIVVKWSGATLVCLLALAIGSEQACATVSLGNSTDVELQIKQGPGTGTFIPGRNPFNTSAGIPPGGNDISFDPFIVPNPPQTNFDGGVDNLGNHIQFDIIVGRTSSGVLEISLNSQLRDENLIIGDSAQINGAGPVHRGTGLMRITGFGALYNNDPNILPPGLTDPNLFTLANPTRPLTGGFDLYVGKTGTGTLEVTAGGTAEIQDSIVAGSEGGSAGTIIVDGSDSFLGNTGGGTPTSLADPGMMVIGRLGTGKMTITNGGQVFAVAPSVGGGQFSVGGMIGGDATSINTLTRPFAGGQGTVTVDGVGSKWIIGGDLQVGGFDSTKIVNTPAQQDLPGANAQYPGNAGRGTLNVSNGALVNVIAPTVQTGQTGLFLDALVGLYGEIHLAGGTVQIDNSLIDAGGSGNSTPAITNYRLLNDGAVSGSGTLTVGQFRNRSLGQVHVGVGEKLVVNTTGQVFNLATDENLFSNYGLIDVLGTEQARAEIDFNHSNTGVTGSPELMQQFFNFRQATAPTNGGRQVGTIVAQSATLRFNLGSTDPGLSNRGLENDGVLSFTGGTNIVSGGIDNESPFSPTVPGGLIVVSGNGTSVTFEDDFANESVLAINSQNATLTVAGAFISNIPSASTINMTLGSHITVAGNVDVSNAIFNLAFPAVSTNDVGEIIPLIFYTDPTSLFTGAIFNSFDPVLFFFRPIISPSFFGVQLCSTTTGCAATLGGPGGGLPGVNDADLNGDGIVNNADLAIWAARFGLTGLGDVNGDGIVDAADYTIIRDHFGAAMGAGAGAGAGFGSTAGVPEPGSLTLLLTGSMLALALRRRRRAG